MIARCARCQGTFTAERFGVQTCPHCGGEVLLADPNAPAPRPEPGPPSKPPPPAPPQQQPPWSGAPPSWGPQAGGEPPPPPPPPGGYGPPPGGGFGAPPPHGGGAPGAAGPELPAPFADREKLGFLRAFFETWKLSAVEPAGFFRRVRIDQTGSAVLFGVLAWTVGAWAQALFAGLTAASNRAQMAEAIAKMPPEMERFGKWLTEYADFWMSARVLVGQSLAAPLIGAVGIFLAAAIFHVLLLLFGGAKRGFDATLTVVGYSAGLSLLAAVPQCGGVIWPIWAAVVLIIALGEAHRCGVGKGAAAVLVPLLLLCACACFAIFAAISAGIGAMGGQLPKGVGL